MTDQDKDTTTNSEEEEKPGKPLVDEPTEPALNPDDDDEDFDETAS
ncbi:MAG: hypothetical protein QOC87_701 [Actinomycetota bacterium]|nr:hypothetical protein [Actinomycetota bacterium]